MAAGDEKTSVIPGMTFDSHGAPIEVKQVKNFPKKLLNEPKIKINESIDIIKSPDKIKNIMDKSNYITSEGKGPIKVL